MSYFTRVQPYQHHTNTPIGDRVGVYSFALKPEEHQPSGTCNFSRIDNATLTLDFTDQDDNITDTVGVETAPNMLGYQLLYGKDGSASNNKRSASNWQENGKVWIFAVNYNVLKL